MLELVLVIGIFAVMASVAAIQLANFQRGTAMEGAVKDIVGTLRLAHDRAMLGEDGNTDGTGDAWGIRFANGTDDAYALFFGATYGSGVITATTTLSLPVTLSVPAESNNADVIFTKLTGTTTATTINITDGLLTEAVIVDASGRVSTASCPSTVQDADGNNYNTVIINAQCWMKENLRRGIRIAGSANQTNNAAVEKYCYNDADSNCTTYGALYQWNEAMDYGTSEGAQGICPNSWHIPTDAEQYALENYLKDSGQTCSATRTGAWDCDTAGAKLLSGGSSGFNAPWGGYRFTSNPWFSGLSSNASYWSSTQNGSSAWNRFLNTAHSTIYRSLDSKSLGYSIRCLKN